YRSDEGADCCAVLRAVLESYAQHLDRKHQVAAADTVEGISRELETRRQELAAQEADYRTFREQAPLLARARNGLALWQESINHIQATRSALVLRRVEFEGQLAVAELALREGHSSDALLVLLADASRKSEAGDSGSRQGAGLQEQLLPLLLEEGKLLRL